MQVLGAESNSVLESSKRAYEMMMKDETMYELLLGDLISV